jgi:hypothetical protein
LHWHHLGAAPSLHRNGWRYGNRKRTHWQTTGILAGNASVSASQFAIRKLMNRSEAFCDMCEELAEAERALLNLPRIAS